MRTRERGAVVGIATTQPVGLAYNPSMTTAASTQSRLITATAALAAVVLVVAAAVVLGGAVAPSPEAVARRADVSAIVLYAPRSERLGDGPSLLPPPDAVDARIGRWQVSLPGAVQRSQRREWQPQDVTVAIEYDDNGEILPTAQILKPAELAQVGQPLPISVRQVPDGWRIELALTERSRRWAAIGDLAVTLHWDTETERWRGRFNGTIRDPRDRIEFQPEGRLVAGRLPQLAAPVVERVQLAGPLAVAVRVPGIRTEAVGGVSATLVVPANAPADLRVAGFARHADGTWFQGAPVGPLTPGRWQVELPLTAGLGATVAGIQPGEWWSAFGQLRTADAGVLFSSASTSDAVIGIDALQAHPAAPVPTPDTSAGAAGAVGAITDLELPGLTAAGCQLHTGERWALRFRPSPWPLRPDHAEGFQAELVVRDEVGVEVARVLAFHRQPIELHDRGDQEIATPVGRPFYEVRYRPSDAGVYTATLETRWADAPVQSMALPNLVVEGEPWREIVQVDPNDPRFLATQSGELVWPVGVNLHSAYDRRSVERIGTRLTPFRPWSVYRDILPRMAANGVDTVEIWLAPWNLALEWTGDWHGYHDLDGYNHGNIERVDRIIDLCESLGLHVILVYRNHVTATQGKLWRSNPLHQASGGHLRHTTERFTDPVALAADARHRRAIVARWADSPAILAWKLWSEQNLTRGNREARTEWHRIASADLQAIDPYHHPVTTHWSGNLRGVEAPIASIDTLDLVVLNAYKTGDNHLDQMLWDTMYEPRRGLLHLGKPILITEYGGSWTAGSPPVLSADLQAGPWLAMTAGHAGAPMHWWWEWIDQSGSFHSYRAIQRFLEGEDQRGAEATSSRLAADTDGIVASAWVRPGRLLGHVLDQPWAKAGVEPAAVHTGVQLTIGTNVEPGAMQIAWYDCATGAELSRSTHRHEGGPLVIVVPTFQRQLAFKAWRSE